MVALADRGLRPRWREARLAPAAVASWIAAALLIGVEPGAAQLATACVLWGAAVVCVVGAMRAPWLALAAVALAAAALVATTVAVQAPARAPSAFRDAAGSAAVEISFVALEPETEARVRAEATLAGHPDAGTAPVLVFLDAGTGASRVEPGERWSATVRLVATEPGDDVAFLAFTEAEHARVAAAPPLLAAAAGLRAGLRAHADALPGAGARLLPGLSVGDTSRVDEALDAAMITSSLSHLTAVSGANCAVVVGAVFAVCAALGLRRGARVAVSLAALVGFVVLVTPEPSVVRASVMAGVVLLALALGRPARGLPALALAVVLLLAIDPWLARSFGFVLSVLATAGLLLLVAPLAAALARVMPHPLALVIAVPLAAQLACQPVLLLLSPSLALWGVPANLLAGPAAPLATVLGLLACLAAPVAPPLASVLSGLAWLPATWIAAVAELFAGAPGARLPWPGDASGVVALVALTVVGLVALLGVRGSRVRRLAVVVTLVGVLAYGGALGGVRMAQLAGRPADWQYALCDVGQGDALVVRSADAVMLVDTGEQPEPLRACLDDLGVTRIDLLVLTHFDLDHVGGTDAVRGRVGTALVGPIGEAEDEALRDELRAAGARVIETGEGDRGALGQLRWRVLWPPASGVEPGNAASIALLVEADAGCAGCLSSLLLGDLGEEQQTRLLAARDLPRVDLLKVAHHGSADFSVELYTRAAASVGVIGVGADNGYGHPTGRVLDALAAAGTAAFRSDLDGLVLVGPGADGGPPRVWTERAEGDPGG